MISKNVSILNYWNSQLFFQMQIKINEPLALRGSLKFLAAQSNHSAHNSLWFIHERDCFIRVSKHEETDERTRQRAECVFKFLETLMKHKARVYSVASPKGLIH